VKRHHLAPLIALGLIALVLPAAADGAARAPGIPGSGPIAVHPSSGPAQPNYERRKHRKKKKKRHPAAPAPAPAPAPAAASPYLLSYEEAYAAIQSWVITRANGFAASDSNYGTWYWDIDETTCHWNYYSGTRSLTCTVYYYDYNPATCHFTFGTNTSWSAFQWTITARPTVPGSSSITIGEQPERDYNCYA
jgi:hypothetical protein